MAFGQVINYKTEITLDQDRIKSTKITLQIQINNKNENWLSHVELKHNPKQEFSLNYATLMDMNGNVVRSLKKRDLVTRNNLSYQAFFQDDLITEFDLYWNQYPYKIEYSYTIKEKEYIYIALWAPSIYKNIKTIKSSLLVNLPSNFPVKSKISGNLIFKESIADDRVIMEWLSDTVTVPKYEIYSPLKENLIPIVKLIPSDFKYGVAGKTDTWTSIGQWLSELNSGTDLLPDNEKLIIEDLVRGIENKKEIIKTIYYYLQDHTKYVNVSIDVGGLKSYPASYVCENKYGDCKALTTYMKAMLKSVGIESYYTVINAGDNNIEIDENLPSQQFNHVILMIPVDNDTIWLENTSNVIPFNYLGTFTQNRYGLVINDHNSKLVKTPKLSSENVLLERNYYFDTKNINEVHISLDMFIRGGSFESFRQAIFEKDKERQVEEINSNHGIKDLNILNWETHNYQRDSTTLQLKIKGVSSAIFRKVGSFLVINPLKIELPNFEKPSERKLDVIINVPVYKSDKSEFDIQSFEKNEIRIPKGIKIEGKYGSYITDFIVINNKLTVIEKFILYDNKIPISNYNDFYEFINAIVNYKKETSILIL